MTPSPRVALKLLGFQAPQIEAIEHIYAPRLRTPGTVEVCERCRMPVALACAADTVAVRSGHCPIRAGRKE